MLYSYDGAGNRQTEVWKDAQNLTVESFNYAYNPGNYLENKGSSSFNTGSYGQMTSRIEAGITTTYAYNPMRMMKQASEAGVILAKYEYDALGRRIISWLDNEWRTVSLWSGNDSIYEIRQEWTIPPPNPPAETITRYVAVNGQYLAKLVGSPIAMQPYFHHTDIVGTVRAVTDIYGAVVARYAYEPFGSLTTASGLVDGELHRFTGKPSDLETDLSYFNARYYDPALGRFTSSDPARDGLNWFQYCNGNPIVFVDQNGEVPVCVITGLIGAGVGALTEGISTYIENGRIDWGRVATGALQGGILGTTGGMAISIYASATTPLDFPISVFLSLSDLKMIASVNGLLSSWGTGKDGINQGIVHFFNKFANNYDRLSLIAKNLGYGPDYFTKTAEGFYRFNEAALHVINNAYESKTIGEKAIYYLNNVVVIVYKGLIQTMMPSDWMTYTNMK